jgi:hypothetical protein
MIAAKAATIKAAMFNFGDAAALRTRHPSVRPQQQPVRRQRLKDHDQPARGLLRKQAGAARLPRR